MSKDARKLYIVYVVTFIEEASGGPRVILEHANNLFSRGHRVEIWTTGAGSKPYFTCKVPVYSMDVDRLSKPDIIVMTDPALVPILHEHRQKSGVFLLMQHDNDWVLETIYGPAVAKQLSPETLVQIKEMRCQIIVVSTWLQTVFKDKYGLASHVILNGIDDGLFHPANPSLSVSGPLALCYYDPQIWKGFEGAYLALDKVRKKLPTLNVALVGAMMPPLAKEGEKYVSFTMPIVYFHHPEQVDLAAIISSATVFISASWREGFGLGGLEALACGVPLVTTDSGGVREYAVNDKTALIVPPKDIDAIAEATLTVLGNADLRNRLTKNGLQMAAKFGWGQSISKLENVFQKNVSEF